MILAFLYYIPIIIWRTYSSKSGFSLSKNIQTCIKARNSVTVADKKRLIKCVSDEISNYVSRRNLPMSTTSYIFYLIKTITMFGGRRQGNYFTISYLICKILFLVSICLQIILLNKFLGFQFQKYGLFLINEYVHGREINESSFFPRVTYCTFSIRNFNTVNTYTLQCVLQINLFLEKIFLALWVFYMIAGIYSLCYFFSWLYYLTSLRKRVSCIKIHLPSVDEHNSTVTDFVSKYLKTDGCFIIRMISHNVDKVTADDIVDSCWMDYLEFNEVIGNRQGIL
ncbi:innexin unc-9-like [Octopus sinensis]|nr:innexin unc-9-like [Octopus sinensis]